MRLLTNTLPFVSLGFIVDDTLIPWKSNVDAPIPSVAVFGGKDFREGEGMKVKWMPMGRPWGKKTAFLAEEEIAALPL